MKKIIKRIAAIICVAVFTISNIVMPVSASFGIGVSAPLVALVSYVLVSSGIISSEQASTYTDTQIINEFFRWSNDPLGTFASTMAQIPIDDQMKSLLDLVIGTLEYTGFADWVSDSQDNVIPQYSDLPSDVLDASKGHGATFTGTLFNSDVSIKYTQYTMTDYMIVNSVTSSGLISSLTYVSLAGSTVETFRVYPDSENNTHTIKECSSKFSNTLGTSNVLISNSLNGTGTFAVYGDIRNPDGTKYTGAEDFLKSEEFPSTIGTVIIDGVEYPISDDGTVTIDGVTYTINDDGTITVDGVTYYPEYDFPVYDDTALRDLLARLLSLLDDTTVPADNTASDDIIENTEPAVISDADFSKLTMDKSISTVFPFCIPFDFYNGLKLLSTAPVAPRFEVPFEIPQYGSFPGLKKMIVIDFSDYDKYFYVVRWGFFTIAMFGMCFLTFKIVKGAR